MNIAKKAPVKVRKSRRFCIRELWCILKKQKQKNENNLKLFIDLINEEEHVMKKTFLTFAMIFTIGSTILAGASLPASAIIGPELNDVVYYEDADTDTIETSFDYSTSGGCIATVDGAKDSLALRTDPSYDDSNIIGALYNGDTVEVLDQYSGEYVWVYSDSLGCCGWVNANYLS